MGQVPHDRRRQDPYVDRMRHFHGTATTFVDATPESVFDFITDIDHLAEWNAAIERVVEAPASLSYGSEWVVVMHPAGLPRWNSRSHLEAINRDALQFVYQSNSDDGNASYVRWTWQIVAVDGGAQVTVIWDGHPQTFWRRVLFAPLLRRPQLSKEVPASLVAVNRHTSRRSVS
jgi:uncharacterized protein YndB with AHSA1/START domain